MTEYPFRVGIGYDIHKLVVGRKLIIGTIKIPYEKGLEGHSDADVLIHSIIDALLGALALGDIGMHFPDTDPQYQDISSSILLSKTIQIINSYNYKVVNIDSTIILEKPKLKPYIPQMRSALASILQVPINCISIKAKTNEGVGPEGNEEAVSAYSVALLIKEKNNSE
ncbi:MAG: 2-C-methyl-D-erythritol 2,4-cyclodiphosphate synthase [Candidatus Hydrogenedentes bacterium]|nr:2-C-methyl-D-erythritol 2,4-cyclodiphosphate synthase [Candidatus Hydrogenedentota bacterium]